MGGHHDQIAVLGPRLLHDGQEGLGSHLADPLGRHSGRCREGHGAVEDLLRLGLRRPDQRLHGVGVDQLAYPHQGDREVALHVQEAQPCPELAGQRHGLGHGLAGEVGAIRRHEDVLIGHGGRRGTVPV